jgi:xanthine dehydrogenase YagS FAD-binding subunit
MRPFTYVRAKTAAEAMSSVEQPSAKFLGGGTNLLDLMKMGVEQPSHLVDITRLPLSNIEGGTGDNAGGLRIGAMARNSDVAADKRVQQDYAVLSQALLAGASPQIRNMATVGGNILQRTRCYYFYDPSYQECNKRVPNSGCAAIQGYNRIHAILGASESCIAVHPSDMAVALCALNARVVIQSLRSTRSVPIDGFYRLPGSTPQIETLLRTGEIITAIELPAPVAKSRHHYLKIRDRRSYAFGLVSVAAVLSITDDGHIEEARIALGGVAPKPWRVPAAEEALKGTAASEGAFRHAADLIVRGAKPHRYNGFKVEMARRAVVRALTVVSTS